MDIKAVLYTRVSTDEQAKGYSLESQMERCRAYASEHDFSIVGEFQDDFTGAVPIEARPEGSKAFKMLNNGEADVLIVYTMDRLVRPPEDGDEWDTPVLIRSLARLNKEIHTVNRGQLKTDFASLLIAMLDAKSAGDERRKIIERTARGRNSKAKSGKVVGVGKPPYGYTYVDGALIIDEDEAKIVRQMYRWLLEDHMTLRGVAVKLSDMRVPTPMQKYGRTKNEYVWSFPTIGRIVRNEVYAGILHFGRRIGQKGENGVRPDHEVIHIPVPAIVSREIWQDTIKLLEHNAQVAKRHQKRFYLLSGMVRCGCGRSMHAQVIRGWYHYRCTESCSHSFKHEKRTCYEPIFNGKELEKKVWDYIDSLVRGDFEADLRAAQDADKKKAEPKLREIEIIDSLLADLEREAETLAGSLKKASGIVLTKLENEMTRINNEHVKLTAKRQEIEREIQGVELSDDQIESLMQFRDRVLVGLEHATPEEKRQIYKILQVKVLIKNHQVKVSCLIASHTSWSGVRLHYIA